MNPVGGVYEITLKEGETAAVFEIHRKDCDYKNLRVWFAGGPNGYEDRLLPTEVSVVIGVQPDGSRTVLYSQH